MPHTIYTQILFKLYNITKKIQKWKFYSFLQKKAIFIVLLLIFYGKKDQIKAKYIEQRIKIEKKAWKN